MTKHEASLRELSEWLIANDHDMRLPDGVINPDDAADYIRMLRDALLEIRVLTVRRQLPLTSEINDIAKEALS